MSSHRASIAGNVEGGLALYRASKAAINMLSRSLYVELAPQGAMVMNMHPGWAATAMGTLDGTVAAAIDVAIDVATNVSGVGDQLARYSGSKLHHYLDYRGDAISW